LIPKELDERPLTRGEQVNGLSNGHSLSRIASAGNGVILAVAGEIDLSNAEEFSDGVRALMDGEGEVVLSLQNCGFIDSTGIKVLIMLARELRTRDQTLVLSGLNGGPRRVFEITGLLDGQHFEIRDAAPDVSAG
jgi:stage II sporulation protein AA (anti-sigma F factor antagonist)